MCGKVHSGTDSGSGGRLGEPLALSISAVVCVCVGVNMKSSLSLWVKFNAEQHGHVKNKTEGYVE